MSTCEVCAAYGDQNSKEIKLFREDPYTGISLTTVDTGSEPKEVHYPLISETSNSRDKNYIVIKISHGSNNSDPVAGEIYASSGKRVARLQESGKENIFHRVHGIRPGVSRFFRYEQFNLWVNHHAE
ncbi:hypothetical protein A3D77_03915 [Candidatus Gottesmanbacteria bacterium RIFCSPHIGHO2_02_FULL_39_11]|uniref:Uncharacterized protein n=1 Tax=Candidatus Gottesmanbacteria bacterium RIFCSPHIGHO2_02_FULL_39_11 TaxID=1798382 RepID=A0A1F5ZK37_9BACT|nr:MAG: hypothetical protein A3D77_03915 [Candidatus Gottesmanbacteria bacterium RIFCSPHIGHO2_02_FULL_39_11]